MTDLLKGLTGGGWGAVYAWIFPSALVVGAFWLMVYPQTEGSLHAALEDLSATQLTAVFLSISVAIGLVLNAVSTPLYRMLEGYAWPQTLRHKGVARQLKRKQGLAQSATGQTWEEGLRLERLSRFPFEDDQVAPSSLGNAIRAFETYGSSRFGLDSQTLWNELCSVVPKYLQDELDRSRAGVDFFVALFYLSIAFGLVTLCVGVAEHCKITILILAVPAFMLPALWYRMAIVSTSYWKTNVQALVNIGRLKLADEMNLQIPDTMEQEREMWGALTSFVYYSDDTSAKKLDDFRKLSGGTRKASGRKA